MKIREAIDRLEAYHAAAGDYAQIDRSKSCDGRKVGDPEQTLTGVAVTLAATYEVVQQAIRFGCNLILCHEPLFYNHPDETDWQAESAVYRQKAELLRQNGIVVVRDHDAMHAHNPDMIYTGVMQELGWEAFRADEGRRPKLFQIPPKTVGELADTLKRALNLETVRLIGQTDGIITRVGYIGGGNLSFDNTNTQMLIDGTEVMIAGELIDWTVTEYVLDAAQMGLQKTIIQLGHFNSEELGMKHMAKLVAELVPELPVRWIPTGEPYRYR